MGQLGHLYSAAFLGRSFQATHARLIDKAAGKQLNFFFGNRPLRMITTLLQQKEMMTADMLIIKLPSLLT